MKCHCEESRPWWDDKAIPGVYSTPSNSYECIRIDRNDEVKIFIAFAVLKLKSTGTESGD